MYICSQFFSNSESLGIVAIYMYVRFLFSFWGRDMVIKILATLLVLPSLYQLHLRKFDPSKYKMIRSL